ncbi:MAG: DNA mismatch repair endonuclease MutL [Legionella sp.]|uniref:DNA mismatch repair endonuclease MutL n=1 Tax=Legionella sp. TaxID=459 RepID=UPI0039E69FB2
MRIQQLPPLIANQIAAGEVIERPASVVKELLENSLDAGADSITIEVGYGGLNQIRISDNGMGIIAEDLPLAVAAHATSKIKTLNDLYAIDSMGFRGEALASIASIAKLTISSRPAEQETAVMLRVQAEDISVGPCARAVGTTIDVVDLFFNAPVRKRFLKGEKLEFQAIETVVKRFALAAPQIAITLKHNGKQVLSLPSASNEHVLLTRMTRLLGTAFMKAAIYLDVERGSMRLYGWISGANFQRSQNDRQWVYINQRMVRDKLVNHAIKQAYEDILHPGRFPACVLYLTINPEEVDVNVHPTKHEVRFQQPRLVHDFFTSQLSMALHAGEKQKEEVLYELISEPPQAQKHLCEPYPQPFVPEPRIEQPNDEVSWVILNNCYILALVQQQPYLVDAQALYQQMIEERLKQSVLPLPSRPLLVPVRYSLPNALQGEIAKLQQSLFQLGIQLEQSNTHELLIRSIPISLPYLELRLFLDAMITLEKLSPEQLLVLMIKSQVFEPRLLSAAEKMELNQLLMKFYGHQQKKTGVFKALTIEDCRNLLNV